MNDIEQIVRKVIAKQLGVGTDFDLDAKLIDDLGADSIDFIELIMSFEDELGITIDLDNREKRAPFTTVAEVVKFIEVRLNP